MSAKVSKANEHPLRIHSIISWHHGKDLPFFTSDFEYPTFWLSNKRIIRISSYPVLLKPLAVTTSGDSLFETPATLLRKTYALTVTFEPVRRNRALLFLLLSSVVCTDMSLVYTPLKLSILNFSNKSLLSLCSSV